MTEDDFAELASGHAHHALSDADERRYLDALAAHPEWAERAEAEQRTAAALAETLAAVEPPAGLRTDLLARIAHTPQQPQAADEPEPGVVTSQAQADIPAAPEETTAVEPRWGRRLFALAASLVLLVALGVGTVAVVSQTLRPAAVIALDEITGAPDAEEATVELADGGTATAHWSDSLGSAVLVTDGLSDLDASQTYELWYVRGDTPVSAGVFSPEDGVATAQLAGAMHAGDVIAVTVEQAGGSPSGVPTTDPIVAIPTT